MTPPAETLTAEEREEQLEAQNLILAGVAAGQYQRVLEDAAKRAGDRHLVSDARLFSFPQLWGSTALGFGGPGGAAMTTAQSYAVEFSGRVFVYFGSRFAYELDEAEAMIHIQARRFPSVGEVVVRKAGQ